MSGPRSRNPARTREFYDSIMADEKTAESRVNVTTKDDSVPKVTETTIAIPAARPQLDVQPKESGTKTTTTTKPTTTATETTEAPLIGMFNNVWENVRGIFGPKKQSCLNGGKLRHDGICDCPKYFNGTACEKKQCLNGGQLHKITAGPITYECQCPNPQFIEGAHCERIRCANKVPLLTAPNGTWNCDCSQRMFYKGVFCESFSPPMGMTILIAVFAIFIICCGLCRMDWCPRKRAERRRDGRSARNQNGAGRHRTTGTRSAERGRVAQPGRANPAQEFLLQGDRSICTRNPVAFPTSGNPYIIRLDTIPTFNPNMIGGVDPSAAGSSSNKPIDPPPSYEQAVQAPPMPAPPRYSERQEGTPSMQTSQQPPPPSIPPPVPPSS